MDGGWLLVLSFSRRFFFQLFFLWTNIHRPSLLSASRASPVDSYGGYATLLHTLQIIVARDYTSMLREITLRCCERLHFVVTRDYISIWIIQPAVRFYRRYEWTAEVYSFSRSLVLSFSRRFYFQLFFLVDKHPRPSLLSASRASPVDSYGAYATPPFFILYNSLLREITLRCYERLQFNVTRDYASSLRDITLHHCERSRFIIMRDYASVLLSLHSYFNYTIRRNILP